MDQRIRPDSLSCENCNSHASRRVPLERQETGDSRRRISDVGECCHVQYCCRANALVVQRNQEALERQDLYDSMKRAMEKKLRGIENRQSYHQEQSNSPFWKPVCKKEQEAVMKPKEVHPITNPPMSTPISTKDELLRVYRESIRRGELASLCMKTKKGRETLTLSVMVKSQECQVPQNSSSREEAFDCYVPPETFPDYLPMCPKAKPDHSHDDAVQHTQSGVDYVKHHHH